MISCRLYDKRLHKKLISKMTSDLTNTFLWTNTEYYISKYLLNADPMMNLEHSDEF